MGACTRPDGQFSRGVPEGNASCELGGEIVELEWYNRLSSGGSCGFWRGRRGSLAAPYLRGEFRLRSFGKRMIHEPSDQKNCVGTVDISPELRGDGVCPGEVQ